MRPCRWAAILMLAAATAGCGGKSSPSVVVSLSPTGAVVLLTNTQQFNAGVGGTQNTAVTWQVCNAANPADATGRSGSTITMPTGCVIGSATLGNINTSGLYTAPATLPSPPTVSIVATSQAVTTVFAVVNVNIDSGIRVSVSPSSATIGTGEGFQFTSAVTGTQNQNAAVTWAVDGIAGGSNTPPNVVGTIMPGACTQTQPPPLPNPNIPPSAPGTSVACYTAPSAPPSGGNITISATSVADTTKSGSSTVSVTVATDPILNSTNPLFPASGVEGSAQQDVYLSGSSFFSTDLVFVNGTLVPSLFLGANNIRAVIPATFFSNASPSTLTITVQNQGGGNSSAPFMVAPTRPAIASFVPDSLPLSSGGPVNLIGGYFSTSTVATSQGQSLLTNLQNSRQLSFSLPAPATPGLQPILIQNSDVPSGAPSLSSLNVAVPPAASSIQSSPTKVLVGTSPTAVAIDSALGIAVVVNQGTPGSPGTVSLINLDANPPALMGSAITVGNMPTSVAVDDQLHLAAVVNSADNTLSIINLLTQTLVGPAFPLPSNPTATSPAPSTPIPPPFSIGVNPLTHRALVAYSSTNIATVVDLSTNQVVCILGGSNPSMPKNCSTIPLSNTRPVSTGTAPQVAVDPQLNWAIVTPGGAGAISLVDLGTTVTASQVARIPNVIATLTLTTTTRGVSIDTERNRALFTDPRQASLTLFSDLDQTVSNIGLDINEVASAVNPLTDVGVVVNSLTNTATVVDLQTLQKITSVTVGSSPMAVAVDPGEDVAVIANQGDNTVSILQLGPLLSPQITEISSPTTFTVPPSSSGSFTLTVNGFGFASGASPASVRLDGTSVPTTVSSNGRQATATIPNSMLNAPRRFALDVMNPGAGVTTSNEENFTVIGAVPVGLNPMSVAVDSTLNEALVTVQGTIDPSTGACAAPGTVSLVNMATPSVISSLPVGTCPEGVAVAPRLHLAVVANNGSNNATVLDYVNKAVLSTVTVGNGPMGVAVQPDTSTVAISNFSDNTLSVFGISFGVASNPSTILVDQGPVGLSVDPDDNLLAVTAATQNTVDIVSLSGSFITGRLNNFQNPTDASFDPITGNFLVANSLANNIGVADPVTFDATPIQAGINPTAIAYNFQSSTAVTVNRATNTMSVLDFLATNKNGTLTFSGRQVREILPMGGSNEFSVAINPMTNVAAVVDQANGRLLLVPLPR
ncbi:MAG TPA: YncE family protein [Candidatus Acidoferrales bacterium]|nr:YncE family protein [Candidatus Acidoferrales bacterium]